MVDREQGPNGHQSDPYNLSMCSILKRQMRHYWLLLILRRKEPEGRRTAKEEDFWWSYWKSILCQHQNTSVTYLVHVSIYSVQGTSMTGIVFVTLQKEKLLHRDFIISPRLHRKFEIETGLCSDLQLLSIKPNMKCWDKENVPWVVQIRGWHTQCALS